MTDATTNINESHTVPFLCRQRERDKILKRNS